MSRGHGSDVTTSSLICANDTISTLYDMMSYFAKLTGVDLSRYLNKIK